jgi:phosphatidylserine decarboxylase
MAKRLTVPYRNRQTGEILEDILILPGVQRWLSRYKLGRCLFDMLLNNTRFCEWFGKYQDLAASRKNIRKFVDRFQINLDELERPLDQYETFNAFFSRRLKPDVRPFVSDPNSFCSPADGKVLVYPHLDGASRMPIKGASVGLAGLLDSEAAAQPYSGGAALVVRLAPHDYHRFHFPVSGEAGPARSISGKYNLVNPIGLSVRPDLFCRNKRTATDLVSPVFGRMACLEIAGLAVGRIVQTYTPGPVVRSQEKGYFQYGGSTLVLLFEPNTIVFDSDLIQDSKTDLEVHVRTGEQIGRRA